MLLPFPLIKLSASNIMEQLSCSSKSKQALGLCCEWPGVTSVKMVRYLIDPENHAINRFTCSYSLRDTHETVRPSRYAYSQSRAVSESCHFTEAWCAVPGATTVTRSGPTVVLDPKSPVSNFSAEFLLPPNALKCRVTHTLAVDSLGLGTSSDPSTYV